MKIARISTQKISELVEKQIEQWITSGKVEPGTKLPSVRELCEQFEVGRSAVRDAITALKGKGLLDVRQGEGAYVCRMNYAHFLQVIEPDNIKEIQKLFTVRKILEGGIAELAAHLREAKQIEELKEVMQELNSSNMEDAWKADYRFHQTVAEATQNEVLVEFMQTISTTMEKAIMDCHRVILSNPTYNHDIHQQHVSIFEAIVKGDATQAKEAMITHLNYVEELLQKHS